MEGHCSTGQSPLRAVEPMEEEEEEEEVIIIILLDSKREDQRFLTKWYQAFNINTNMYALSTFQLRLLCSKKANTSITVVIMSFNS